MNPLAMFYVFTFLVLLFLAGILYFAFAMYEQVRMLALSITALRETTTKILIEMATDLNVIREQRHEEKAGDSKGQ